MNGIRIIVMKKFILGLIAFLLISIFSCSRDENQGKKFNENNIFESIEKRNYNKISRNLFIHGVKSYSITSHQIIFDTYRSYNINNIEDDFSKYKFEIKNNEIYFNGNSIGIKNNKLYIKTKKTMCFIDSSTNFNKLDFESKILFSIFIEIFGNDVNKKTFNEYIIEFENTTYKTSCSWIDTYYISGWGMTSGAAWADYHNNSDNFEGLPSGKTCSPLGSPQLRTNKVNLAIVEFDFYQVDRAYCCH